MATSRYQLDPTGVNPNNLVVGEIATVNSARNTTIITTAGAYYADSLVIYDSSNLTMPLVRNTDYVCLELVEDATAKYGKEIYQIILFYKNPLITSININYQAVGGYYEYQTDNIQKLYDKVLSTNQDVQWFDILNKPLTYVPSNHINMLEDIYGFEPVVYALERLRDVIGLTNSSSYQVLLDFVNNQSASQGVVIQAALDLKADKSSISNINNTSDLDKPISTATQAALDLKVDESQYTTDQSVINDKINSISTASIYPGTIDLFAEKVIPDGWSLLDGNYISVSENPMLYSLYAGTGSNIPDITAMRASISDLIPAMTGYNSPTGYSVSTNSDLATDTNGQHWYAWYAFDKVNSTDWLTYASDSVPIWIQVSVPAPKVLTNYLVRQGSYYNKYPASWEMLGYTTDNTWVVLDTQTSVRFYTGGQTLSFTVPDSSLKYNCTKFKLNILSYAVNVTFNGDISAITLIGSDIIYKQAPSGYFYLPEELTQIPTYPGALRYIKKG